MYMWNVLFTRYKCICIPRGPPVLISRAGSYFRRKLMRASYCFITRAQWNYGEK